jgi:hypothetical protein
MSAFAKPNPFMLKLHKKFSAKFLEHGVLNVVGDMPQSPIVVE